MELATSLVTLSLRWTAYSRAADRSWRPAMASKRGARLMVSAGCKTCKGKGAVECPGCKGTGKNKKNGNIFERWKCFDCQGFGLKSCPSCGKGGLTPEQRGER
ncbi:protein PHOTOSYSTEM I ASSEMBLY 2, chloroplastic [Phragmites australis]|uniref:protein PHOTOSYSTEM I ASSEMBLY 2, chloroplastic n=1 Tax=Phragmites australis TaxID=29695 RepID=UPI002D770C6D|nr:protein PHOTOSYSTEM I ASSEMBLY 2, chloroplastic [Phragmites australis]